MAASVSGSTKFLSALASHTLSRCGYVVVARPQGVVMERIGKTTRKEEIGRSVESEWIPDPVTGYYRPANRATEIDVAELRDLLLKHRIGSH